MTNTNKEKILINKEKYQMKNEFLMKLRYFFETHADPLPYCSVNQDDIDANIKPKRAYMSFGDFDNKNNYSYVYADCFENIVAKGYPLNSVVETLWNHGILTYIGCDDSAVDGKIYKIQDDVLDDKLKIFTEDEILPKLMLLTMLLKRKLENAIYWIDGITPQQMKNEHIVRKIRHCIYEADSRTFGLNDLFSEAKTLLQILENRS